MRDTVSRAQEAPASASVSHRSHGGPAGPSTAAAPREHNRDGGVIRATVQPAHRVRGWLVAAPR